MKKLSEKKCYMLLNDICCKFPHGVKVMMEDGTTGEVVGIDHAEPRYNVKYQTDGKQDTYSWQYSGQIQTYLRPMESMTPEERADVECYRVNDKDGIPRVMVGAVEDWLNRHMFDYRGMIRKGLALPAPDGMYHFETPEP